MAARELTELIINRNNYRHKKANFPLVLYVVRHLNPHPNASQVSPNAPAIIAPHRPAGWHWVDVKMKEWRKKSFEENLYFHKMVGLRRCSLQVLILGGRQMKLKKIFGLCVTTLLVFYFIIYFLFFVFKGKINMNCNVCTAMVVHMYMF